jgi:glycerol kinase
MAHIARAALESIAYQSAALLQAMSRDAVATGGAGERAARGRRRLREQPADAVPGRPAGHSRGAPGLRGNHRAGRAYLAGLSSGVYQSTEELSALWKAERRFVPTLEHDRAQELMARWEHAVGRRHCPTRPDSRPARRCLPPVTGVRKGWHGQAIKAIA